jgi:hypothetical protein
MHAEMAVASNLDRLIQLVKASDNGRKLDVTGNTRIGELFLDSMDWMDLFLQLERGQGVSAEVFDQMTLSQLAAQSRKPE